MKTFSKFLLATFLLFGFQSFAQDSTTTEASQYSQWSHGDIETDSVVGISLEKAYAFMHKKNKVAKPVVVAIIDSGVDTAHEDLKDRLWINLGEIPYNGIDDDKNGYIDDVYGWNFIGNANGENVNGDTWELTRLYRKYKKKFGKKTKKEIAKSDMKEYQEWLRIEKDYKKQRADSKAAVKNYKLYLDAIKNSNAILEQHLGPNFTKEDVESINTTSDRLKWAIQMYEYFEGNPTPIEKALEYHEKLLSQKLNPRFHTRQIVGDDVNDINDRFYGNNDVTAETSGHGTGVAGIVAATRNNGIGVQGIADSVRIMIVRVVPGGDERDKDVALGIRYAVDNGAQIINGSFGKSYSAHKEFVDSAIVYAERHGVLIVHAAGNSGENNDKVTHYPTPEYAPRKFVNNWIDVGASSSHLGLKLPASFSNYGRKSVDIFAPGVDIRSTSPKNKYGVSSGTSDASPVVTGVAALVLSYYPELTAVQLKEIILKSARKYPKQKVLLPGDEKKKTKFKKLSKTAGVVNAYEALKLAEEMYGDQ
ncbi:MAG: peptidase S8 [Bacteroidetes bacterium]|nr:MAG: peptidase S8 [Bacteroidota bacterium]